MHVKNPLQKTPQQKISGKSPRQKNPRQKKPLQKSAAEIPGKSAASAAKFILEAIFSKNAEFESIEKVT